MVHQDSVLQEVAVQAVAVLGEEDLGESSGMGLAGATIG